MLLSRLSMTTPRKSPSVPRSPSSGVGNSRFTNYLHNKSPSRSPASRLSTKYPTSTTPPDSHGVPPAEDLDIRGVSPAKSLDSREIPPEEGLGEEIHDLSNEIRELYNFISTKNTPEGAKKAIYGPEDIGTLVNQLIYGTQQIFDSFAYNDFSSYEVFYVLL